MKPLVSIVMGSDSDLEIMNECAKALDGFDIPYEIDITSAVALLVRRPASPKKQPAAGSKSSSPQPVGPPIWLGSSRLRPRYRSSAYRYPRPAFKAWTRCFRLFRCLQGSPLPLSPLEEQERLTPEFWRLRSWPLEILRLPKRYGSIRKNWQEVWRINRASCKRRAAANESAAARSASLHHRFCFHNTLGCPTPFTRCWRRLTTSCHGENWASHPRWRRVVRPQQLPHEASALCRGHIYYWIMSAIDKILEANRLFALDYDPSALSPHPRLRLAVVTCMDTRLSRKSLGLSAGDAHLIRNAGGIVTDDVLRSLLISHYMLGTNEFVVINHTDCGLLKATEEELKETIGARAELHSPIRFHAFLDPAQNVRDQLTKLAGQTWIRKDNVKVRGFVFDVQTGFLSEIAQ